MVKNEPSSLMAPDDDAKIVKEETRLSVSRFKQHRDNISNIKMVQSGVFFLDEASFGR